MPELSDLAMLEKNLLEKVLYLALHKKKWMPNGEDLIFWRRGFEKLLLSSVAKRLEITKTVRSFQVCKLLDQTQSSAIKPSFFFTKI